MVALDSTPDFSLLTLGTRVGVMLCYDLHTVYFFGYGTYVGRGEPLEAVGPAAELACLNGRGDDKIVLDNGQAIYGCECWYADETAMKNRLAAIDAGQGAVVMVDIGAARAAARKTLSTPAA